MPLTLKRGTEGGEPVGGHDVVVHIRCDHCGEPLRPDVGGAATWEPDPRRPYLDVAFVHRSCREGHTGRRGADRETMDLGSFLRAALHNLEVAG
jgi:hypothetical protein